MHTQNMGQDNNSPSENVHNMKGGTFGQCIGKEKKYVHTLSTQIHSQNIGQDNNLPTENENVHNTMSAWNIRSMDRKREEIHARFNTNPYTQNMGPDNNSLPENVHNMMSDRSLIGKENKYKVMHFSSQN